MHTGLFRVFVRAMLRRSSRSHEAMDDLIDLFTYQCPYTRKRRVAGHPESDAKSNNSGPQQTLGTLEADKIWIPTVRPNTWQIKLDVTQGQNTGTLPELCQVSCMHWVPDFG